MSKYVHQIVCVKVEKGRLVKGKLYGFDPFMNVVLENATCKAEGSKPDDPGEKLGQVLIRGCTIESVVLIGPDRSG